MSVGQDWTESAGPRRGMSAGIVAALGVVIGLALAAPAAAQHRRATPVVVAPVVEREMPATVKLVGTALANREAVLAAEVGGRVVATPIEEGSFFHKGDVVCVIDDEVPRLKLAAAQARLDALQATLEKLENGTREEELRSRAAQRDEAQAMVQKWAFERKRVENLAKQHQSSEKEVHDAEMEFLAARARLAAAQAAYDEAVRGPRQEDIAAARADVATQRAVVAQARRDLNKTRVRAPYDAFLVARQVEVGQWVAPGGAVADVVEIERIKIRASVPESAIRFARVGEPAGVRIEALARSFEATITRVIPQADADARTVPVEIDLPNADHAILPGMFAWVRVPAGPRGKRLTVSPDAIVMLGGAKMVYVVRSAPGQPPMAMPVPVETGLVQAGAVEVRTKALRPGDLVVVRGNERLMGPTPVAPMPAGKTPPASQPTGHPPASSRPAGHRSSAGGPPVENRCHRLALSPVENRCHRLAGWPLPHGRGSAGNRPPFQGGLQGGRSHGLRRPCHPLWTAALRERIPATGGCEKGFSYQQSFPLLGADRLQPALPPTANRCYDGWAAHGRDARATQEWWSPLSLRPFVPQSLRPSHPVGASRPRLALLPVTNRCRTVFVAGLAPAPLDGERRS